MFTGIVEGCGQVRSIEHGGDDVLLVIAPPADMSEGCSIGDSICINGCCLTVVEITDSTWAFQAGEETLSKTNLGDLAIESPVNLERSLAADGRLGGHIVQGHVDGTGNVDEIIEHGEWTDMWFKGQAELVQQMVPKGSVAIDGVSLTLVNVEAERFSVALIPHTLDVTTLGKRAVGDRVNLETDILGKYIHKYLANLNLRPQ